MGHRRFKDRNGAVWDVRDASSSEWEFIPTDPGAHPVRVPAPGYQKDPFEVSAEELQRLLDAHHPSGGDPRPGRPRKPSPFKD
jgi:hypothetical protein